LTTPLSIDTGIDYTHPALGGKFGPGNKVIGGYDFVGDLYNGTTRLMHVDICVHNFSTGSNDPIPDSDPLDQCDGAYSLSCKNSMLLIEFINLNTGHGTHVAVGSPVGI